ncbi:MAPEG family protein [Paraburkholderia strydomiana]|uniref:MAPEG family protein n=1 Tax=Paraburkholderia strydomiana TaxID=1245417 RepID=UPI00286541A5|nr:MAPEG family protein [Paraburkholderia strydomiana]MDR7009374.1 putative MAPEG superfamily protein [Paraburkholderia strydomiana]
MTSELLALVGSGVLCLALPLIYVALYARQVGMPVVSGNREGAPEPTGIAGRGIRAHRNLLENLVPFAIVVLAARWIGVSNSITVAGAWLFLGARVVHVITYLAGIKGIRTLAYLASLVGTVLVLSQLF